MTLPVIQPFDYPDWGQPGTVTATGLNIPVIAGPGETIYEAEVGYYNHTLLIFDGNGDGNPYSVVLKWYTASPSEGGSVQITQFLTVAAGCIVVVPVTNPTTYLRVDDAGGATYPHNVLMTITQFAAWGSMVGYPGGEMVLHLLTGTSGAETLVWSPGGCAPGRHSVLLKPEQATWDLYLRVWYDPNNQTDFLIADETTPKPWQFEFIGPASSWQLVFATTEAGDHDVNVIVTRLPT